MQDRATEQELEKRLSLIVSMIAEGAGTQRAGDGHSFCEALRTISPSLGPRGVTACGLGRPLS